MKFLSMLVFIALAVVAFVFMALRPPVSGNAINLGVPFNKNTSDTDSIALEKSIDKGVTEEAPQENEATPEKPEANEEAVLDEGKH